MTMPSGSRWNTAAPCWASPPTTVLSRCHRRKAAPPREAPRKQLNEILEARAEELFIHVGSELVTIGMDQKLLEGIFLTGGGALLNGMCDMAERVLNCPARIALPERHREFSGRTVHSSLDDRGRSGQIFRAIEDEAGEPSAELPD